jgi:hypothetical protein
VILATTVTVDILNGPADPPTYLTGLLGLAGGAFFGAVGSDNNKRKVELARDVKIANSRATDINETAIRAEHKADQLGQIVKIKHPDEAGRIDPPLIEGPPILDPEER